MKEVIPDCRRPFISGHSFPIWLARGTLNVSTIAWYRYVDHDSTQADAMFSRCFPFSISKTSSCDVPLLMVVVLNQAETNLYHLMQMQIIIAKFST